MSWGGENHFSQMWVQGLPLEWSLISSINTGALLCAEHGVRQPLLSSQMGSRVGKHEAPQASGAETDSCLDHDTHFLPMGSVHYATQGTHVPSALGIHYEDNI